MATLIRVVDAMHPDLCPGTPPPPSRSLLSEEESLGLERVFTVLASATRLRLLHALTLLDDPCMGELADAVGMKPQAVSNQLRRLVDIGILDTRRHGSHVHYRIVDAGMTRLLQEGLRLQAGRPVPSEGGPA